MKRFSVLVVITFIASAAPALAGSGGISPDSGGVGIGGPCSADQHGEFCVDLIYQNEHEADRYGLLKVKKTDDRGVSPLRGVIKLQKQVDGQWITLDRRGGVSRANQRHTAQRLRLKLPIMHVTDEPHRLIALIDRERVAHQDI